MSTLIGFKDEEITDNVDWSCNKFGGLPDWMIPGTQHPSCKVCGELMWHIAQVYCPLSESNYHRTLNTFVCIKNQCLKKHGSATVYRSQLLEVIPDVSTADVSQDDWGTNDWVSEIPIKTSNSDETTSGCDATVSLKSKSSKTVTNLHPIDNLVISYFKPFYVFVLSNSDLAFEENTSHEQQLYEDYVTQEFNQVSLNNTEIHTEVYERTSVKHGDHAFYRLQKKISGSPSQCMRYRRNGEPLILSSVSTPTAPFETIPPCPYCNKHRVFEMQFMPHITTCLVEIDGVRSIKENREKVCLDFGCLYVFTCSGSCWDDGEGVREEYVIIQPDPDEALLSKVL